MNYSSGFIALRMMPALRLAASATNQDSAIIQKDSSAIRTV